MTKWRSSSQSPPPLCFRLKQLLPLLSYCRQEVNTLQTCTQGSQHSHEDHFLGLDSRLWLHASDTFTRSRFSCSFTRLCFLRSGANIWSPSNLNWKGGASGRGAEAGRKRSFAFFTFFPCFGVGVTAEGSALGIPNQHPETFSDESRAVCVQLCVVNTLED